MDKKPQAGAAARACKVIKRILLWALSTLFAFIALMCLISGGMAAGLFALAVVALAIPIAPWQDLLGRYLKGGVRAILAIALVILCLVFLPTAEESAEVDSEIPVETSTVLSRGKAKKETTITVTPKPTAQPTPEPMAETTTDTGGESATEPTQSEVGSYVVNINSGKFHRPSCSSAGDLKEENRWDYSGTRDELVNMGYSPCKRCEP